MVVTDDELTARRCRNLRNLCFQKDRRFVHEELGWNYRMTNLQAAISEYKTELRLVYKDMPENVEFNLEKAVFQVPPQPPVKKKEEGK